MTKKNRIFWTKRRATLGDAVATLAASIVEITAAGDYAVALEPTRLLHAYLSEIGEIDHMLARHGVGVDRGPK